MSRTESILQLTLLDFPFSGRDEETEGARDENDAIVRQEKATRAQFDEPVTVFIDGYPVVVPKAVPATDAQGNKRRDADGELIPRNSTIYDAALRLVADGVWTRAELDRRIPVLCHQPHLNPIGVCRMCAVWIVHTKRGVPRTERKLLPACQHLVSDAMRVTTRVGREGMPPDAQRRMREWAVDRAARQALEDNRPWEPDDAAAKAKEFDQNWGRFLKDVDEWAGRIRTCQGVLTELLVADHAPPEADMGKRYENELYAVADTVGVTTIRPAFERPPSLPSRNTPADRRSRRLALPLADAAPEPERVPDAAARTAWGEWNADISRRLPYSSRTVVVDHDRCILCDRCVRSCSDVKPFKVIGHTGKGYDARISFDLDELMGESSCVQCGECMTACPTGALTVRRRVQPRVWDDSPQIIPLNPNTPFVDPDPTEAGFLTAEEMRAVTLRYRRPGEKTDREIRPFATIPFAYLKWNEGAVRRWVIPPGGQRILCREGEYASTAFLTDGRGKCRIHGHRRGNAPRKAAGVLTRLFRPHAAGAAELGPLLHQAPGTDLIQGELGCMSHARRSATVVAVADADQPMWVYEITRNLLDMMQRAPSIRDEVSRLYAYRAVEASVRKSKPFDALATGSFANAAKLLTDGGAELRRLEPGQVVVRAGDLVGEESYFYIVRVGTLRVFRQERGVDQLLTLLGPGDHFGEIALLGPPSAIRTATVAALDPAEVVLVPKAKFLELCDRFPKLQERLVEVATERRLSPPADYVDQGIYQAQKLLALDLIKCTRCDECTKACADSHPDGHARLLRDGLRFGHFLVATSCRSCHTPYCMDGCPVDAIHRRGTHLEVLIEDHCIGCGLCERNCPYGSIHMVKRETPYKAAGGFKDGDPNAKAALRAVNCDLCGGGEPFCVEACPHDAAVRTDGQGLLQLVIGRRG